MRRKLPKELSKRNLIRDNSDMLDRLHAYKDIIESQMVANIQLELNLSTLQKKYDALTNVIDHNIEEELHV